MDAASETQKTQLSISDKLSLIHEKIRVAAEKAGRNVADITLVAVSKTKPLSMIIEAHQAGQIHFGENRAREMRDKQAELSDVHWHMIGNLQRNKVKYLAEYVHLIHSVDSIKLLQEIDKQALKYNRVIDCLLEIHISDENSKSGMTEEEAKELLANMDQFPHIHIKGLMGMAEFSNEKEIIRSQFRRLKNAFDTFGSIQHASIHMDILSMGMTNDFEIAIQEGANMVRIGSAIFGSRN